ncbi:MAG: hypothetical protein CMF49_03025 [Legionellales bacterium]|nr:hypothetical protein [Legionellales bacterium]|tara:strand:+ start:1389 stop:2651 length:1263 start_codon:yes stop_codon:yes gene_type:complete
MKFKTLQFSENLYSSYWLYPLTFAFLATFLLIITLRLDTDILKFLPGSMPTFDIDVLRKVLSLITTSSISITSVVFSITVLTLSLASSQLGPRLLPTFIRQGKTQLVIAVFIGIYVYCLLLLAFSSVNTENNYIASFIVGVLLGIISFLALIYFIHYVCKAIQIENVLNYLSNETVLIMNRSLLDKPPEDTTQAINFNDLALGDLFSQFTGYIQSIDYDKLIDIAKTYESHVELLMQPGDFLTQGIVVARYSNMQADKDALETAINQCFFVGMKRTPVQDIEYGFEQIVEIAVRALSPGINNPFTAIYCIHQFTYLLTILSTKYIPNDYTTTDKFTVHFKQFSYQSIIETAIEQLRFCAVTYCSVTITLLKMIKQVLSINHHIEIELTLKKQAKIIYESAQQQNFHPADLQAIKIIYDQI